MAFQRQLSYAAGVIVSGSLLYMVSYKQLLILYTKLKLIFYC